MRQAIGGLCGVGVAILFGFYLKSLDTSGSLHAGDKVSIWKCNFCRIMLPIMIVYLIVMGILIGGKFKW